LRTFLYKRVLVLFFFTSLFSLHSCTYRKGEAFKCFSANDTLRYLILARGRGSGLSAKVEKLVYEQKSRGNSCQVRYFTDSMVFLSQRGVLLFHAVQPGFTNDILTKGYFGGLSSKQIVNYCLVSYDDLEKYFQKEDETSHGQSLHTQENDY
jgi:hypothetical protein